MSLVILELEVPECRFRKVESYDDVGRLPVGNRLDKRIKEPEHGAHLFSRATDVEGFADGMPGAMDQRMTI